MPSTETPPSAELPCQTIIETVSTTCMAGSTTSGWECPVPRGSSGWAGCAGCSSGMGDPHLGLRIIHVAGTKGKGSTSAMIAAALSRLGRAHRAVLLAAFAPSGRAVHGRRQAGLCSRADRPGRRGQRSRRAARAGRQPRRCTADRRSLRSPRRWACCTSPAARSAPSFSRSAWAAGSIRRTWSGPCSRSSPASRSTTRGNWATRLPSIATEKAGILKRGRPGLSGVRERRGASQAIRRVAAQRRCRLREIDRDFRYDDIPPVPPLVASDGRSRGRADLAP